MSWWQGIRESTTEHVFAARLGPSYTYGVRARRQNRLATSCGHPASWVITVTPGS